MASGLTLLTAYTWSKAISGPSDIGGQVGGGFYIGSPQDIYYLRGDRAVSGFDVTQRFVTTVLYDVPFFHGLHGAGKLLLDGWQASFILTAQSGFPTQVNSAANFDTTGTGITSRPDSVARTEWRSGSRSAELEEVVQHRGFRPGPIWAIRYLPEDGRVPPAGLGECRFFRH